MMSLRSASISDVENCSALVAAFATRRLIVLRNLDFESLGTIRRAACHDDFRKMFKNPDSINLSTQLLINFL